MLKCSLVIFSELGKNNSLLMILKPFLNILGTPPSCPDFNDLVQEFYQGHSIFFYSQGFFLLSLYCAGVEPLEDYVEFLVHNLLQQGKPHLVYCILDTTDGSILIVTLYVYVCVESHLGQINSSDVVKLRKEMIWSQA